MATSAPQNTSRHLILYDGVCGLCNRFNAFILPRDPREQFYFAPIQSEMGRSMLLQHGRNPDVVDALYVLADYGSSSPRLLSRARAALFVSQQLGGIWRFSSVFGVLPDFVLNFGYDAFARHRYRFFGRYDACPAPKAEDKSRFPGY
jgi:predicted DCC family thiol-disulfide oxidoreductase YuxK